MAFSLIEKLENHDGLLTVPEIAQLTGFTRKKVYDMIKRAEIPTVNFGSDTEAKRVDPKTWAFVIQRRNPMMREAHRKG